MINRINCNLHFYQIVNSVEARQALALWAFVDVRVGFAQESLESASLIPN